MNVVPHHLTLKNEFEFKSQCALQSIKAFEGAIDHQHYPTRINFACIFLTEISLSPFYLAWKVNEAILYSFWHLLNPKDKNKQLFEIKNLCHLSGLLIFQFSIPFICTAIRICATISGLLVPYWALRGWKIAESGEELSYHLWSQHLKEPDRKAINKNVREEIIPSNAIFYLGKENAYFNLVKEADEQEDLESEISSLFSDLLQDIAVNNPSCFRKLFYYDSAITPSHQLCKKHRSYLLSHDIKQMLFQLKQTLPASETINQEDLDNWLIDQISKGFSIEQIRRMFSHVYLNLQAALLVDDLNLDQTSLETYLTTLNDLFCERFGCGRAHFPQCCSLQLYSRF